MIFFGLVSSFKLPHNVPKLGEGGFPYTSITDKYIEKFRSEGAPVTAAFSKVLLCEVRYTVSLTGTGRFRA